MNLVILPGALSDLRSAYIYYEEEAEGLGAYFYSCLFADIETLSSNAGIHSKVFGYHRKISERFPFAIYYFLDGGDVCVFAVLDCRRNPEWIRLRLRSP